MLRKKNTLNDYLLSENNYCEKIAYASLSILIIALVQIFFMYLLW
jgi:hypothetical protein